MIRELFRKGVSISEIARRTGRDRKTIRQIVNAPELAPARHPRQVKACKIDPYLPYLEQRMAEGVFNARKLYGEILAQGYPGKESKVREFVHERRPDKEPVGSVRFETAPGEQGQVDWGSFGFIGQVDIGGCPLTKWPRPSNCWEPRSPRWCAARWPKPVKYKRCSEEIAHSEFPLRVITHTSQGDVSSVCWAKARALMGNHQPITLDRLKK
jgi:hypothetical protein